MIENNSYTFSNPDKETWDKVARSDYELELKDYELELANEIINIFDTLGLAKSTIIETGSGSGHLSAIFAQHGYNVTLVDYSNEALNKSKELFKILDLNANFYQADITSLTEVISSQYDVVFSSGVLEHFDDEDLLKILEESYKVSKKYLVFLVPNVKSLPYLLFRMKAMKNGDWIYGKEYLRDNYEEFIKKAGFKILKKEYLGMFFSRNYINYVFNDSVGLKHFEDLMKFDLIPKEEAYLTAFVAIKE
jgi:2-polyprenyl-3-methyl-5-hydroxy-6-metoxy-1,4-benzoquinol methylase